MNILKKVISFIRMLIGDIIIVSSVFFGSYSILYMISKYGYLKIIKYTGDLCVALTMGYIIIIGGVVLGIIIRKR